MACQQCEMQGPHLPFVADAVAFHRAAHDLFRLAVEPWAIPVVEWLARRLDGR